MSAPCMSPMSLSHAAVSSLWIRTSRRAMRSGASRLVAGVLLVLALAPRPAGAQNAQGVVIPPAPDQPPRAARSRWLLELHGGFALDGNQTGGSGTVPTTAAVAGGLVSASTFSFGNGTTLFNESAGTSKIAGLDGVLTSAAAKRRSDVVLGITLERKLTPRLSLEFSGDYVRSKLSLRDETLSGFERTQSTMKAALQQVLATGSVPSTVTVTITPNDDQPASRLVATGALVLNLRETGRTVPYILGGGGVLMNRGSLPAIALQSQYGIGNPAEVLGSDTATLFFRQDDRVIVFMGGAGVKHGLSPRTGLRFDVRVRASKAVLSSFVDAVPSLGTVTTGAAHPVVRQGALRFDAVGPLNRSGIAGAETFTASGMQIQTSMMVGLFFRL